MVYLILEGEDYRKNSMVETYQWNAGTGDITEHKPLQVWLKFVNPIPYEGDGTDVREFDDINND